MGRRPIADFSDVFDWRPLDLLEVPSYVHVCKLCGVIAGTTFVLDCGHAFCVPCYRSLRSEADPHCPVDDLAFRVAVRTSLSEEAVSNLRVHCWNAAFGCRFVGSPRAMLDHHGRECRFHFVSCPRCREKVLHGRILHHRKNDCLGRPVFQGARDETFGVDPDPTRRGPSESTRTSGCPDVIAEAMRTIRIVLESVRDASCRDDELAADVLLAIVNCEGVVQNCVNVCTDHVTDPTGHGGQVGETLRTKNTAADSKGRHDARKRPTSAASDSERPHFSVHDAARCEPCAPTSTSRSLESGGTPGWDPKEEEEEPAAFQ